MKIKPIMMVSAARMMGMRVKEVIPVVGTPELVLG
jgi:hypothetical protein